MATWTSLRARLAEVDDRLTLSWAELDTMVGGLPPSAHDHQAFWSGDRSSWSGFRTTDVRVGHSVTFVRAAHSAHVSWRPNTVPSRGGEYQADLLLVGCVKSKLDHPAMAKDLYVSALFQKERAYAEASEVPWFILSAKHGLVAPDEVIEPYDVYLKTTSADYREAWGRTVVGQLAAAFGSVAGVTVEVHASSTYVDQLSGRLESRGARVVAPLEGLSMGQRLAWYGRGATSGHARRHAGSVGASGAIASLPEQTRVVEALLQLEDAMSPREFLAVDGTEFRQPGMYSWWVDPAGAEMLSAGLGHRVEPRLIYAGLAGATRSRSGLKSTNTLWGRISGMHLGGRHEFSTFRLSLGSILAKSLAWGRIDEDALTGWMFEHLSVVAVPVTDADSLDDLETVLLHRLDPPLNLMKMPKTALRQRLSELRSQYKVRKEW